MIKLENTEVMGWEAAIRGMRNPMNSWEKSDSIFIPRSLCNDEDFRLARICHDVAPIIKNNDFDLMMRLRNAGTDHRKFMRMITVYVDITAPLYWWKEFDTYKVGTVANSCSTMHKISEQEFVEEDFSFEHIYFASEDDPGDWVANQIYVETQHIISALNAARIKYLETQNKRYWWQMIQLLPSSYNQKRTVMLNYEVLANIYKSRRNHKLDEWAWHDGVIDGDKSNKKYIGFCDWIETLPYSELVTGYEDKGDK